MFIARPLWPPTLQLHFDHHRCREVKEEEGERRETAKTEKTCFYYFVGALRHNQCCKCIYIQNIQSVPEQTNCGKLYLWDQIHTG